MKPKSTEEPNSTKDRRYNRTLSALKLYGSGWSKYRDHNMSLIYRTMELTGVSFLVILVAHWFGLWFYLCLPIALYFVIRTAVALRQHRELRDRAEFNSGYLHGISYEQKQERDENEKQD